MRNIIVSLAIAMAALPAMAANSVKATVNGMVCAFCAQGIEKTISKMDATKAVFVDLKSKVVLVEQIAFHRRNRVLISSHPAWSA